MLTLFKQQRIEKTLNAIHHGDQSTLIKLLTKIDTAWLNEPQNNHPSLLEVAIKAQQPKLLEQLINAGGNPNQKCTQGHPILRLALEQTEQSLALMTALLKGGAQIDQPDFNIVGHCFSICPPKTLMLHLNRLEQYGLDLTAQDNSGNSVLDYALPTGNRELLLYLVNSDAPLPLSWPESCPQELKSYVQRCAEDRRVRQMFLER